MSLKCNTCLIESNSESLQDPAFVLHMPFYDITKTIPVQGDTLLIFSYAGPHLKPERCFISVPGSLEHFRESGVKFWAHMPKELYPLTDHPDLDAIKQRQKAEEKERSIQRAKEFPESVFNMKEWYSRIGRSE